MRIDLNGFGVDPLQRQQKDKVNQAAGEKTSVNHGEDTATLSNASTKVRQMEAQVLQTPEIRKEKVEALRQAVQSGDYKVDSGKIADAMLRELSA